MIYRQGGKIYMYDYQDEANTEAAENFRPTSTTNSLGTLLSHVAVALLLGLTAGGQEI